MMSYYRIHEEVDTWKWVTILQASSISIGKIHTHPPFAIRLFDYHYIGQPIRVVNLSNEIRF